MASKDGGGLDEGATPAGAKRRHGAAGAGTAPNSLARALMRTSASLPQLHSHLKPPHSLPTPSARTGNSRLRSVPLPEGY